MNNRGILSKLWPSFLLAAVVLLSGFLLYRACYWREDIRFLGSVKAGRWMLYPTPLQLAINEVVPMDCTFRRSFSLNEPPQAGALELRAFKSSTVRINGTTIPIDRDARNWKKETRLDITRHLKLGENQLLVTVTNDNGPPALWLNLLMDDKIVLVSDEKWEASLVGATWLPAGFASDPIPLGNADPAGLAEDSATAMTKVWLSWLVFVGLAITGIFLGRLVNWPKLFTKAELPHWILEERHRAKTATALIFGLIALLWLALIVHNSKYLPPQIGFDADGHLAYISHFTTSNKLLLPGDGWQTHHPPLYHFLVAIVLNVFQQSTTTASGILIIRLFNGLIGIGTVAVVLLSLRLVFPQTPRCWLLGLLVAGFLPMSIYYHHYPSNHVLGAFLGSLSVYLTLRILILPATFRDYAYLGVALGLGLLCVISVIALVAPIGVTVAVKAYRDRDRIPWSRSLCHLMLWAAITGTFCGWYYLRVWQRFGTPIVANVGAKEGSPHVWWQQPGYRTEDDYLRFGLSLWSPMFSARYSVWDGFYSTVWGDSFGGGTASVEYRPPWSYNHIAAGMLLAFLPTLLTVLSFTAALVQWLRKPTLVWGCLLGVIAAVGFLLIYSTVLVPFYSTPKSFYGFAALVPGCILLASGLDYVARFGRLAQVLVYGFLVLFCCNVIASYWIPSGSADAEEWIALQLEAQGRQAEAIQTYEGILAQHPESTRTRVRLAKIYLQCNAPDRALTVLQLAPGAYDLPSRHHLLARLYAQNRQSHPACIEELRTATEAAPDDLEIAAAFANTVTPPDDPKTSITIFRNLVRIVPYADVLHGKLAGLYRQIGDTSMAEQHERWAARLKNQRSAK